MRQKTEAISWQFIETPKSEPSVCLLVTFREQKNFLVHSWVHRLERKYSMFQWQELERIYSILRQAVPHPKIFVFVQVRNFQWVSLNVLLNSNFTFVTCCRPRKSLKINWFWPVENKTFICIKNMLSELEKIISFEYFSAQFSDKFSLNNI